jgi:hypothetical protein
MKKESQRCDSFSFIVKLDSEKYLKKNPPVLWRKNDEFGTEGFF